jgi:signal transduction histidine kinase
MMHVKNAITRLFHSARDFFIKHPALLSGYIIYAYFFITTMGFYKDLKETHFKSFNIIERFDALIWMWLLAVVLVKVIEYRHRLTEQERMRLEHQKELEIRTAQLATTHKMIRTLQHQINNPLSVILLYTQRALRKEPLNPAIHEALSEIKNSAERITNVLKEFAQARGVETVDSPVGDLITPSNKNDTPRTMDEAGTS